MLPEGSSTGSRHRPRDSFQSSLRKSLKLLRKSDSNCSYYDHLPIDAEPTFSRATFSSSRPPGARTFFQRAISLFRRQPVPVPERQLSPLPRVYSPRLDNTSRYTRRNAPVSLTRLVLPSTDDVSFSSSSFFRRVEEVRALNARSEPPPPPAPSLPSVPLPLRPPPRPPRRRPPPPVDESPPAMTTSSLPSPPPSTGAPTTAQQSISPTIVKTDLDSALELKALATKLDNLKGSSPLLQQRLYASPSIKSARAGLPAWSSSSQSAVGSSLGRDPLTELLAVADELKTMRNFDSDDILYMTDASPLPPLPPTLHAFLDAPNTSLHILEMEIHRESETFLGIPIPCIVVTSEREPLPLMNTLAKQAVPLPRPSEVDMLAPPPATYRGRSDADHVLVDVDLELDSPPASPSPYEDPEGSEDVVRGSPTPSWDYTEYSSSADSNWSWEALSLAGLPSTSNSSAKPVRPTASKPAPLLRRHQRSLLCRVLGGGGGSGTTPTVKDKSWRIPSYKQRKKRVSKEAIGFPRPLSPTA